ncbi:MAG: sigma-70 family RNA polymerase sigma factor [Pseudomonadales bacterium]|nr:sigma-70 family RNA polymerase sigma factor [Pseudomonadales bacterium]
MSAESVSKEALKRQVDDTYATEWGRSVAFLLRLTRDLQTAEDCVQDAFESALVYWRRDGVPNNPGAWIRKAAKHRFIDAARSSRTLQEALQRLTHLDQPTVHNDEIEGLDTLVKDDELALIFLCCHPAIAVTDQVMLTLRTVTGLPPKEIAAAFFAKDEAVRTRLLRAKRKIRGAAIPIKLPEAGEIEKRLKQVFAVIYLIFNEGYLASRGENANRQDLTREAVRLAARLVELVPINNESHGLLALLLFTDSRTAARLTALDELVPLDEQDRTRWDHDLISIAFKHLDRALACKLPGRYALQAAIAAEHSKAVDYAATDWKVIVDLYDCLLEIEDSVIYRLNRCVAISFADSPLAALEQLAELEKDAALQSHHLLSATRADFLRRAGKDDEALSAYKTAVDQADNAAVQKFLQRRVLELEANA